MYKAARLSMDDLEKAIASGTRFASISISGGILFQTILAIFPTVVTTAVTTALLYPLRFSTP
ncbi:MAG: hypothetical protein ABSA75_14585 [Candidatus Bathyarchaeia archaeon]|jgi:hypothetical protein